MKQKAYSCDGCGKVVWVIFDHPGLDCHILESSIGGRDGFNKWCGTWVDCELSQDNLLSMLNLKPYSFLKGSHEG